MSEPHDLASRLQLVGHNDGRLPEDRGRMLDAQQVADLIGGVKASWVRRNMPGKLNLGHSTKRWWEADVLGWIQSRREDSGDRR